MNRRKFYTRRFFDFEIGYLVKSPCRGCGRRVDFPGCMDECAVLDRVQTHLAQGVASCRNYSPLEAFSVQLDSRRKK